LIDPSRQKAIVEAYRETCRLLGKFAQQSGESKSLHPLVIAAADEGSKLSVDVKPRLLIFGTKSGKSAEQDLSWVRHERKIKRAGIPMIVINDAAEIQLPVDGLNALAPGLNGSQ
jgi:hypothetical protein